MRQCPGAGVTRVWMHQTMVAAGTSVAPAAVQFCADHGITVIAGTCPMMYVPPVDFGHRFMRTMLRFTGGMPKPIPVLSEQSEQKAA